MISEVSYMQSFLGSHTKHQHAYCEPVQRLLEGAFLVKLGRKFLDTLGSGLLCSLRSLLCFPCPCILSWFPLLSEVRRRICESWNGWACCYSALTLGLLPSAWKAFTISLAGSVLRSLVTFVAVPLVSYLFVFLETLIFFSIPILEFHGKLKCDFLISHVITPSVRRPRSAEGGYSASIVRNVPFSLFWKLLLFSGLIQAGVVVFSLFLALHLFFYSSFQEIFLCCSLSFHVLRFPPPSFRISEDSSPPPKMFFLWWWWWLSGYTVCGGHSVALWIQFSPANSVWFQELN